MFRILSLMGDFIQVKLILHFYLLNQFDWPKNDVYRIYLHRFSRYDFFFSKLSSSHEIMVEGTLLG